jgi:large subunit ribosomal protein L31
VLIARQVYSEWRQNFIEVIIMKNDIHPEYQEIEAKCSCGNVIKTRSTLCKDLLLDVCSACHPFYTGKQKVMDTGGRIDKFKKRFGSRIAS